MSGDTGRGEPKLIGPADLVGRTMTGVIATRLLPERVLGGPGGDPFDRSDIPSFANSGLVYWDLLHLWIQFEGLGSVYFSLTLAEIDLVLEYPYPTSEGELSATRVGAIDAPAPLAALVGATIAAVTPLYGAGDRRPPRRWRPAEEYIECGHILETTKGTVAIADVGDDYAIGKWPDAQRWDAVEVVTDVDPRRLPRQRA